MTYEWRSKAIDVSSALMRKRYREGTELVQDLSEAVYELGQRKLKFRLNLKKALTNKK